MRIIARFSKKEQVRFISHLDIQRLFGRAFRRAGLPVAYSQGFNPHPVLAFATALATGVTSDAEWLDVGLECEIPVLEFTDRLNAVLPQGLQIIKALAVEDKFPSLTASLSSAEYTVTFDKSPNEELFRTVLEELLSEPIIIIKRTKGGMKPVDIRPQVLSAKISRSADETLTLILNGVLNSSGSLNPDTFTKELLKRMNMEPDYKINRDSLLFGDNQSEPV